MPNTVSTWVLRTVLRTFGAGWHRLGFVRMNVMRNRRREIFARLRASLRRSGGRVVAEERNADHGSGDWNAARRRFWSDLREGQREAEARSARSRT